MNAVRESYQEPIYSVLLAVVVGIAAGLSVLISPIILPILVVLGAGVYYFAPRPLATGYLFIVVLIFTSSMPRGQIVPMLTLNEVLLLGLAVVVVMHLVIRRTEKPISGAILFAAIVLILTTVVIPVIAFRIRGFDMTFQAIFKTFAPVQYLLIFFLFSNLPRNDEDRMKLIQLMFLCATLVGVIGLLQAAHVGPVINFLKTWYPSDHTNAAENLGRVTSVFGAWNILGTFLMTNLLLLAALQSEKYPRKYQINMVVSAVISLMVLLASGSYASIAGLIMGYAIIKFIDPRGLKLMIPMFIVGGIGLIILFPLISERFAFQFERSESGIIPQTLEFRIALWRDVYIPLIARHPIWGVSPTVDNLGFNHVESQYLLLMFRSGMVALVGFIIWFGTVGLWLTSIVRTTFNEMRAVAIMLLALLATLLLMGITNPVFTYSGVIDYFWILLALVASKQRDKLHVAY